MNTSTTRRGMAVTSLVLGIVSVMCLGIFAGIPAIILGQVAYRRARKKPDEYSGSGFALAGLVMGCVSILTTIALVAILAGMALPALAKAKSQAQRITCMNNMKNIGLAFRIWATDHQDQFPFNATTNETQTAQSGKIVFDAGTLNSAGIFKILANELSTPRILVCPADGSKQVANDFSNLHAQNVSYEVEMGPEVKPSNPQEILVRCPIHGHELYCDGSVH